MEKKVTSNLEAHAFFSHLTPRCERYIFQMSHNKKDTPLVTFAHAATDIYVPVGTLKDGKTTEGYSKRIRASSWTLKFYVRKLLK